MRSSSWSPAAWPRVSFTALKRSRSMNRTATSVSTRSCLSEGLLEPVEQQRPVRQPGEGVGQGQLCERLLPNPDRLGQFPLVGDVPGQDEPRPAMAQVEGRAADLHVDQRSVLLPVHPRPDPRSPRGSDLLDRPPQAGDVGSGADIGDRHPEELVPGVAVVLQGGVIYRQEPQGVAVVHPHRRRVGVEQEPVPRADIHLPDGIRRQVDDDAQRAGISVFQGSSPLRPEGPRARKEAPGAPPVRRLGGHPAGRGQARSFASPDFPGFAGSSGRLSLGLIDIESRPFSGFPADQAEEARVRLLRSVGNAELALFARPLDPADAEALLVRMKSDAVRTSGPRR